MRPEEQDLAHLWDMLEAARTVVRLTEGQSLSWFLASERETTRLAVERKLEILGEAARRVSESFLNLHPEIPWKEIVGLRNIISHQYDKVDHQKIFRIAGNRLASLIQLLDPLVPPAPAGEEQ